MNSVPSARCAALASGAEIQWNISTGPHVSADGAPLYNYSDGQDGKSSSWLYNPATGKRVMGEYNDGTFDRDTFPPAFDGPDLWISVHADKGIQPREPLFPQSQRPHLIQSHARLPRGTASRQGQRHER